MGLFTFAQASPSCFFFSFGQQYSHPCYRPTHINNVIWYGGCVAKARE